jgi:hypothetical protein
VEVQKLGAILTIINFNNVIRSFSIIIMLFNHPHSTTHTSVIMRIFSRADTAYFSVHSQPTLRFRLKSGVKNDSDSKLHKRRKMILLSVSAFVLISILIACRKHKEAEDNKRKSCLKLFSDIS